MRRTVLFFLAAAAALTVGSSAHAKMPFVKKAKDGGFKVENCQSCHMEKMPKKDAKLEYNEMGKFLLAEKAKHKAAEVDVAWLKDYKGK